MKLPATLLTAVFTLLVTTVSASAAELYASLQSNPSPQLTGPRQSQVEQQRAAYIEARQAFKTGDAQRGLELRNSRLLRNYPLAVWLDYYSLSEDPSMDKYPQVIEFIRSKRQQELGMLLRDRYIDLMGDNRRYREVLELFANELPYADKARLTKAQLGAQCRFYEAQWALGQAGEQAPAFAGKIYQQLSARPAACTGLIALYDSKGYLSDAVRLEKFERAYVARDYANTTRSLAAALERTKFAARVNAAMTLYDQPGQLFSRLKEPASVADQRIAAMAFMRWANLNPDDARASLKAFKAKYHPSDADLLGIYQILSEKMLGRNRSLSDVKWVDQNLPEVGWSEAIKEQRMRRAIWFAQWKTVYVLYDHLDPAEQQKINWRYWKGRAAMELGHKSEGRSILREVAQDRSFFGFYAAQSLGTDYAFNHEKLNPNVKWPQTVAGNPAVIRFFELYAMNDGNAIYEWREIARQSSRDEAMLMAQWALQNGNSRYAIDSVVSSGNWDALDYRFPIAYRPIYEHNSRTQNVDLSFIYGISRQESMLNPVIRSPAGAVGLMQLMPGTASDVSRKNKWPYAGTQDLVVPENTVRLGTAYLRQMLDKFDNNRVLAAAAYNAGPGRIPQWKSKDGRKRDAAMFVESIPFQETRTYVQNVLLYDSIYSKLLTGNEHDLIYRHEMAYSY